jgi:sulfite exporter TauE/SafE
MGAFALGTLPSLLATGYFARKAGNLKPRQGLRRAAGVVVALMGLFGLVQLGLHAASMQDLCIVPMPGGH